MEEEWITPLKVAEITADKHSIDYSGYYELTLLSLAYGIDARIKGKLESVIGFNGAPVPSELLTLKGQEFIIQDFLKIAAKCGIDIKDYKTKLFPDSRAVAFDPSENNNPEFVFSGTLVSKETLPDFEGKEEREKEEVRAFLNKYKSNGFELELNYNEAIDFILFKDRANLCHTETTEAHKKAARKFMIAHIEEGLLYFRGETAEGDYLAVWGWGQIFVKFNGERFAGVISNETREGNAVLKCEERGFYVSILHYDGTCSIIPKLWRYEDLTYNANRLERTPFVPLFDYITKEQNPFATEPTAESIEKPMTQQERGRKGGKAQKSNKVLKNFVENFVKQNQSATFEKAWKIWQKQKTYTFENSEIIFTETQVEIDGKPLKKYSVRSYFYDAKKV